MAGAVRHAHRPIAFVFHHRSRCGASRGDGSSRVEQQPCGKDESGEGVEEGIMTKIDNLIAK